MAILNRLACLPSEAECYTLSQIQGVFEIWQPRLVPGASPQEFFLLNRDSDIAIRICSDYRDVQFKFECLYLKVYQQSIDDIVPDGTQIGLTKCQKAKVVLRAEWERPALPGEVPPHYEQIVQVRGEINTIPADVPACISMVGVLLFGEDGLKQGLVYLDDDFPLSLGYVEDTANIIQFLSQSTVLAIDEVEEIRIQLWNWTKGDR